MHVHPLDPAQVEQTLRAEGLLPDAPLAVYCAGSVIRGWGNPTSDVDVYVVTDEPWAGKQAEHVALRLAPENIAVEVLVHEGRRWDVEYWTDGQVEQVLAKVSHQALETGADLGSLLEPAEFDLLDGITHGLDVSDHSWRLRRHADLSASALRTLLISRALLRYDEYAEDAVGQLAAGDHESAVITAKLAFGFAIDALLAGHGWWGKSPKWRARRFRAAAPAELTFERYWRLETMADFDPDQPRRWVEDVLMLGGRISMEVEL
ncbi:hypothetical protein [Streptomyces collinus]|uniref:hypothetical protein n=1 Tax=Streptomyces collinus TaxID=42684 RepID=UPI0029436ABE|nr:hypothetical protein [Streptomyces collinus]